MNVLLMLLYLFLFGEWNSINAPLDPAFADDNIIEVGAARVDITPEGPIRLAGYGNRDDESEGVLDRLEAKALAFGSDEQEPSLFITVDLIGIPGHITAKIRKRIAERAGVNPSQLIISSSHTHAGPEVGNLLNHFGEPLPADQLGRIVRYLDQLTDKLEEVAVAALESRSPSFVAWGQGEANFAMNRRIVINGKWEGFGTTPDGPVDRALPLLRVTDLEGNIKALLVNYACHGTTLGPEINKIHNDWMGEAQRIIEERHPGAIAMVSIGAGADANPEPRLELEHAVRHGKEIADEVDRLLNTSLKPVRTSPVGNYTVVELPFAHIPSIDELIERSISTGAMGYYARLALDRMARGESIPENLSYPIQTWKFGDDLLMIFLAGEVVADYSIRLKNELKDDNLWITAYANDVPGYIASRRVIREGGYEAESSMYSYGHPSRFSEEIEDIIVEAILRLIQ